MRRLALLLIAACGLAACGLVACGPAAPAVEAPPPTPVAVPPAAAPPPPAIDDDPSAAARIAADVTYLASAELGGRGTGEDGARLAADFVSRRFTELKLTPAGSEHAASPYLQAFSVRVGATVKDAELEVKPSRGNVAGDGSRVTAADGSASGAAHGKAVFVGFGITAPAAGWDDYAGADLTGKIAVILDGVPEHGDLSKKPADKVGLVEKLLRDFDSPRYKLRTAREHHAVGAVLIRAGEDLPAALVDPSSMGVPAVVVTRAYADRLFPRLRLREARTWRLGKAPKPAALPPDEVRITTQIVPVEATTWNVAALLPARAGSPTAGEVVVVGAHYDHLGHGGPFSLAPGSHAVHPGADDNASGTALVLEVARRFTALPTAPDRGVLFLAFGAEEIGALGSRYWVEHPTVPLDHVVAMINADMVGRLREERLIVDGVGTSTGWRPLVDAAAQGLGLDLAFGAEGFGASDHASFTAVRVPVAFFFTGVHPDYHRPSDTADKINAAGEERVATLAGRLALEVAQAPARLTFVDAPADPHRGGRGGLKVSLGTIPDYGYAGKGVRLDGVRPDAPAARAGLARGDVIVKVGPHDVGNIHDYMFALGELEAGREVVIEVEREGKRVPLKVIPAPGR